MRVRIGGIAETLYGRSLSLADVSRHLQIVWLYLVSEMVGGVRSPIIIDRDTHQGYVYCGQVKEQFFG